MDGLPICGLLHNASSIKHCPACCYVSAPLMVIIWSYLFVFLAIGDARFVMPIINAGSTLFVKYNTNIMYYISLLSCECA